VPDFYLQTAANIRNVPQQSATMYKLIQNRRLRLIPFKLLELLLFCIGVSTLRHTSVLPLRTFFVTSDEKASRLKPFVSNLCLSLGTKSQLSYRQTIPVLNANTGSGASNTRFSSSRDIPNSRLINALTPSRPLSFSHKEPSFLSTVKSKTGNTNART
jgi:hypothetical protein